jgi:hypothetical protein
VTVPVETVSRPRSGHGGARVGAGRKRGILNHWPGVLQGELRRLADEVARLHKQHRDEAESGPAILKRLVAIERKLDLVEAPVTPKPSRRHPMA